MKEHEEAVRLAREYIAACDALVADGQKLSATQRDTAVIARALLTMHARAEACERVVEAAVAWRANVERHGRDGVVQLGPVVVHERAMIEAIDSLTALAPEGK